MSIDVDFGISHCQIETLAFIELIKIFFLYLSAFREVVHMGDILQRIFFVNCHYHSRED